MPRRGSSWAAASALALILVAGWAGAPVDQAEAGGTTTSSATTSPANSTGATTTPTTTAPATETATSPATETSRATSRSQTNKPVVTVPQLPIGGGADDPGDVEQCVNVSFLGDEIPQGIRIVPAAATFSEPLFVVGGSECSTGDTPCLTGGFAFTAENDDTQEGICFVGVRATGGVPPGDFREVQLRMTGRLECPPGQEAACEQFAELLEDDVQTIPLTPPTVATTTTSSATETTETTATTATAATQTSATTEASTSSSSAGTTPD